MSGKKRSRSGPETAPGERRSVSRHKRIDVLSSYVRMPMHSPTMPAPGFCEEKNKQDGGAHSACGAGPSISRWNDRSDREIDIGYRCVPARRSIVLIGQSDFSDAGSPRTVRTVLRATLSSPARTRTTATRFTLNVKSSIRIPARSERTPPQECETLTLRSLALKLNFFRTLGARHIGRQLRFGALRTQDRASPIAFNKMRTRICAKSRRPNSHASIALRQGH